MRLMHQMRVQHDLCIIKDFYITRRDRGDIHIYIHMYLHIHTDIHIASCMYFTFIFIYLYAGILAIYIYL